MSSKLQNFVMPLVFLGALLFSLLLGDYLPELLKSFLYSLSIVIKNLLIFTLPIVIFSLVFHSVFKIGKKAISFVFFLIPVICCSNFLNTMWSYVFGASFLKNQTIELVVNSTVKLKPLFDFHIPFQIVSNDMALLYGFILGIMAVLLQTKKESYILKKFVFLDRKLSLFSTRFFKILIPIMPFFVIGTAIKLQHEKMLTVICSKYVYILAVFVISSFSYITLQYLMLAKFNIKTFLKYIKNIFQAVITGFGSMSSVAALPFSIKAAENNLAMPQKASIVVPSTVNVHLVGDCFFIPMMALAVMFSFGMPLPGMSQYFVFAFHFVMAKFAVAAVPGGGVLVMLPVMQHYLGFNADMLAIVTALYILFDPIITACNIYGNGAFAILFEKLTPFACVKGKK